MFAFSTPEFRPNKLVEKNVPSIDVDAATNTVKCKDSDT